MEDRGNSFGIYDSNCVPGVLSGLWSDEALGGDGYYLDA